MSAQIHIDRNGERFGPFSLEDANSHLASGSLQPTDLAWSDGMQSWVPIGQIPGIITSVGSAAPPPPAPAANPTCPNCHTEVESSQLICMNCGTNLQTGEGTNTRSLVVSESGSRKKMVLVAAFAVPLLGLAAYFGVNHFFSSKDIKTAQTQPAGTDLPTEINESPKEPEKKELKPGDLIWESYAPGRFRRSELRLLASPSIGPDGNIYVGMVWGLIAIDNKTGERLWSIDADQSQYSANKITINKTEYYQYTSLTPLISTNGTIYLGAEKLYAINPGEDDKNGTTKWVLPTGGGSITAPLSASKNGVLFVASQKNLLALNSFTGAKIWGTGARSGVFNTSSGARSLLKSYGGTLFSMDETLIGGSNANTGGGLVWAVNPSLLDIFGRPATNEQGIRPPVHNLHRLGKLGLPAMGATGAIYVGSFGERGAVKKTGRSKEISVSGWVQQPKVYAISETTCTVIWESPVGGSVVSSPSIGQDLTIYVGASNGSVYAIDHLTGKHKWVFKTGGPVLTTPAIGNNGVIYVGSNDGKLYALNPDGTKKWIWEADVAGGIRALAIASSPTIGPDGTIYFLCNNGKLRAVKSGATKAADSPWPMFGQNSRHTYSVWFPYIGDSRPPGIKKPWTYNINRESIDRIYFGQPYAVIKKAFGIPFYSEGRLWRYDGMAVAGWESRGKRREGRFIGGSVWFQFFHGAVEKVYVTEDPDLLPISRSRATFWSIGTQPGRKNIYSLLLGKTAGDVIRLLGSPDQSIVSAKKGLAGIVRRDKIPKRHFFTYRLDVTNENGKPMSSITVFVDYNKKVGSVYTR